MIMEYEDKYRILNIQRGEFGMTITAPVNFPHLKKAWPIWLMLFFTV